MSDDIILKVTNLSKQYRLGTVGTGTLSHDLNRAWHKLRGKEDPYLKIGAVNDRGAKATSDYVWALQDINFEVKRGEILGIIGKNGAGKSTLLKILSRVTSPTTGSIKVGGRMASLLEVGTGMHPELTGRENIYLNGAILGMTKAEIASKIDEIVAFSGCEMYIDTPVKRYSSGMGVRLGFAVAAFLEPDILVVDEVLAVGDAEFQKKAIGKMQDISSQGGRTVLFVSHNMAAVKELCTSGILLENGLVTFVGTSENTINKYLNTSQFFSELTPVKKYNNVVRTGSGVVQIEKVSFFTDGKLKIPQTGASVEIKVKLVNSNNYKDNDIQLDLRIDDLSGQRLLWLSNSLFIATRKTCNEIIFKFDNFPLNLGNYEVTTCLHCEHILADWVVNAFQFTVDVGYFYPVKKKIDARQSKIMGEFNVEIND